MQPLRREPPVRRASRDPAPSRTAYKFQRLWLTPLFRSLLRTGLPAFALAFGALWLISDVERTEALAENITSVLLELNRARPSAAKGTYMQSCHISTTMGPSIKVDALKVIKG